MSFLVRSYYTTAALNCCLTLFLQYIQCRHISFSNAFFTDSMTLYSTHWWPHTALSLIFIHIALSSLEIHDLWPVTKCMRSDKDSESCDRHCFCLTAIKLVTIWEEKSWSKMMKTMPLSVFQIFGWIWIICLCKEPETWCILSYPAVISATRMHKFTESSNLP